MLILERVYQDIVVTWCLFSSYQQKFDLESDNIVVRGIGTAVTLSTTTSHKDLAYREWVTIFNRFHCAPLLKVPFCKSIE